MHQDAISITRTLQESKKPTAAAEVLVHKYLNLNMASEAELSAVLQVTAPVRRGVPGSAPRTVARSPVQTCGVVNFKVSCASDSDLAHLIDSRSHDESGAIEEPRLLRPSSGSEARGPVRVVSAVHHMCDAFT